jgi:hypothetical protein
MRKHSDRSIFFNYMIMSYKKKAYTIKQKIVKWMCYTQRKVIKKMKKSRNRNSLLMSILSVNSFCYFFVINRLTSNKDTKLYQSDTRQHLFLSHLPIKNIAHYIYHYNCLSQFSLTYKSYYD